VVVGGCGVVALADEDSRDSRDGGRYVEQSRCKRGLKGGVFVGW
jgi:hypothetical protein